MRNGGRPAASHTQARGSGTAWPRLFTHYALRITHYALRITHYALRITHYALRITHQHYLVRLIRLLQTDVDPFGLGGRHVFAYVVGADGQLSMAAVHQHGELDVGAGDPGKRPPHTLAVEYRNRLPGSIAHGNIIRET